MPQVQKPVFTATRLNSQGVAAHFGLDHLWELHRLASRARVAAPYILGETNVTNALGDQHCEPCSGAIEPMSAEAASALMDQLHVDWLLADSGAALVRRFEFKGFAKPVYHANLAAFLGDQEGHHPDVRFGWGYCEVEFTTHDAGGLTQNDFICAAKFDRMISTS